MTKSYYVEEIQDPTTGEMITVTAGTEAELERRVEERLGETFPDVEAGSE
ncbi:hypothetical protein ACFVBP_21665 [Nocardioides sp. NPDC057764]